MGNAPVVITRHLIDAIKPVLDDRIKKALEDNEN